MSNEYEHRQGLRITFTPAEFDELNRQARKHKMHLRAFIEYMARCYVNAVRAD